MKNFHQVPVKLIAKLRKAILGKLINFASYVPVNYIELGRLLATGEK